VAWPAAWLSGGQMAWLFPASIHKDFGAASPAWPGLEAAMNTPSLYLPTE